VKPMKISKLSALAFVGAAVLLVAALAPTAEAGGLKANVFLVQATVPRTLSEKALLGFARKNNQKILREATDADVKARKWNANMIVAFNQPVGDLEFTVLFYDIHDGPRRFVNDMATFVDDKKQKTFVQKVTLPRPSFKPNRNMELVVTVHRQEVGRVKFGLVGEEIRRSGTVDFGDSER
jgi:hypothetical protein